MSNTWRENNKEKSTEHLQTEEKKLDGRLSPIENTVYGELKLSNRLLHELKTTKAKLNVTEQKMKDAEQNIYGLQQEIEKYKGEALQ